MRGRILQYSEAEEVIVAMICKLYKMGIEVKPGPDCDLKSLLLTFQLHFGTILISSMMLLG